MMRRIKICIGDLIVLGELNESPTATLIWEVLPIEGKANLWGEEIYFTIPIEAQLDTTATDVVQSGDIGYWPPGNALCIFFGRTPISNTDEIRPASPVNRVGMIKGDPHIFQGVNMGEIVRLER